MRWDQVEGNWRQYRGKVRKHWGRLTDQHIAQINGKRDQLVRKIQEVYRVSEEEAQRQVNDWERALFRVPGFPPSE
jgi:uncharacterized protein YjbJ (UPF0337 family)